MRSAALLASLILAVAPAARAEVVERSADHFALRYEIQLEASPEDFIDAIQNISVWWNRAHTYSGSAANLSIDLDVGACFCERLADGEVLEHGAVAEYEPETGVLIDAALGPLRGKGDRADWSIGWAGNTLAMTYVVRGAGLGALADPVDRVMGGQFSRMTHFIHYGKAPTD